MKIAVIGLYYASNLGDAVICDCVVNWFREEYPEAQIDVIDIEGKHDFPQQKMSSTLKLKLRQKKMSIGFWLTRKGIKDTIYFWCKEKTDSNHDFYDKIAGREYDLAVFAGGQIFMDWLSLDVWEFVRRFQSCQTPVLFNACGIGGTVSHPITEKMKWALSQKNVRWVSTRDGVEKINRIYFNGQEKTIKTYDPALWTSDVYKVCKEDSKIIGLGVMYCEQISYSTLVQFWCDTIRCLEREGREWKMFCNGFLWDYKVGCDVLDKLGYDRKTCLLEYPEKPMELVKQISGFDGMISFRLHSQIIAVSMGIPCVGIQWDDKLGYFYQGIDAPERCFSISSRAEDVVEALFSAQKKGYNRSLIEEQKRYARNLLMEQSGRALRKDAR